jgi:hypothetical protein
MIPGGADRHLDPTVLLSVGNLGIFPGGRNDRDVKLTTHVHLVPKMRIY